MKKSNAYGLGSVMLGILILLTLVPTIAAQINEGLTYFKKTQRGGSHEAGQSCSW